MLEILRERYDDILTVTEVSELLRVTPQTVYAHLARGDFPIAYGKIGKRYLFNVTDVAQFLTRDSNEDPKPLTAEPLTVY